MAVSYVGIGAHAAGTTSLAVPFPTGIVEGQMLIMFIANKYPTNGPTLPSGWTAPANNQWSGGSGVAGIDTGSVYTTVYYKIAAGTETGNQTVTITSGNVAMGIMYNFTRGLSNEVWDILCTGGADNTGGASPMVVNGAANLSLDVNDMLVGVAAVNSDSAVIGVSSISATGATLTTQVGNNSSTSQGDDMAMVWRRYNVTGGPSTAAPSYSVTATPTATDTPAGSAVFVRVRAIVAAGSPYILSKQAVNRSNTY